MVVRNVDRLVKVHDAYATPRIREAEASFDARRRFTEKDAVLITYGDLVVSDGRTPLRTLSDFAFVFFRGLVTTVHVLPFFPSSSDRGFSIVSYEEVDPRLGSWEEIARLGRGFRLMFDGVFNHISSKSRRFQKFLAGDPEYDRFFRVFSSREEIDDDLLKLVLRPRTSDLLSEFATVDGPRWLWTTFSRDQIDLNFRHPRVLVEVLEILLSYVRRGADLVRLDAVTYIWHELGTSCAHLKQTHEVVKLIRDVLDAAAPHVALVTETNVPHADNVTYLATARTKRRWSTTSRCLRSSSTRSSPLGGGALALGGRARATVRHDHLLQFPRLARRHRADGRARHPPRGGDRPPLRACEGRRRSRLDANGRGGRGGPLRAERHLVERPERRDSGGGTREAGRPLRRRPRDRPRAEGRARHLPPQLLRRAKRPRCGPAGRTGALDQPLGPPGGVALRPVRRSHLDPVTDGEPFHRPPLAAGGRAGVPPRGGAAGPAARSAALRPREDSRRRGADRRHDRRSLGLRGRVAPPARRRRPRGRPPRRPRLGR
ncbi:MAG: hypothetical protein IPL90_01470 [Holophagales bacterium]|nr:hypothetical protein [Holophagales bacterium]